MSLNRCTINGTCVFDEATVTMSGCTVLGPYEQGAVVVKKSSFTVSGGHIHGAAPLSIFSGTAAIWLETRSLTIAAGTQLVAGLSQSDPIGTGAGTVRIDPSVQVAISGPAQVVRVPVAPITLPFGDLWISTSALLLDTGIVPPTGSRSVSFVMPTVRAGTPIMLQAITTTVGGQLVLSAPTSILLR